MWFIKKNKNILLSSSIFIVINNNIYCGCRKCKKCNRDTSENNDSTTTTENQDHRGNLDPKKDQNPPQNPPKPGKKPSENPQKTPFELKKEELLKKIEDLKKLCPKCKEVSSNGITCDLIYLEELKEKEDEIKKIKQLTILSNKENDLNDIEKKINSTINFLKLGSFDIKINKIEDEIIKSKLKNEKKELLTNCYINDITKQINELEKKINDQLNKEDPNRKDEDSGGKDGEDKNKKIVDLFKKLEDLKVNILKKIDLEVTNDQITGATTILELNNIETTLRSKETEINKIINDQNTICSNKDEFKSQFGIRKNILADKFNDPVKNHLKNSNLTDDEINEYYQMYQEMTENNEVFNHQIALDLQIYRYILKLEGFITAFDNIFTKNTQYWFLYLFAKSNANTWRPSVIKIAENNYKFGLSIDKKDCLEVDTGDFCVENEKFKYLRCKDGCKNGDNCVSCKLRKLLKKEDCLDLFLNIYKQQGEASDKPEAMSMKRILFTGLKNDKQKLDYYYSTSNEYKLEKFKKDVDHNFIKCVMIEWALTIEFMKKFIAKYYGSDKFDLYRTFGPGDNNFIDLNTIKHDLYESTCLIAPAFIPQGSNNEILNSINNVKLCSFTKTKNYVKYYRCFFNHIISPDDKCILKGDYEHEIGFIGINEKYERISDKSGDEYIKEYNEFLSNATLSNAKKNLPGANINLIN